MRKNLLLAVLMVIFTGAAFTQPPATVFDIIVGSPEHDTLETALLAAELDDDLQGAGPFTVFAPTDDAFAALPAGALDLLLLEPTGALAKILLYHVVGGSATRSTDLTDGQTLVTLSDGKTVTVGIQGADTLINQARLTITNLEAGNGIVHVIDAVLEPPVTLVEIVANSPVHNTLETALTEAELIDDLSAEGPFTVFAPTDDAFAALPDGLLDTLLADPTGDLAEILLYHVVDGQALSTDLSDGQMITTLNGDSVKVTIDGLNVMIDDALVISADAVATNGVVHVIDAVLIPEFTVWDVIVDSPDHATLETAVEAANLAETLAGDGPFTVFAPTDAAFNALPAGVLDGLLADPEGALAQILLYHVAGEYVLSTDLSDGQFIPTLSGDSVYVKIDGSNVFIENALVTTADIETDNGVVHVIDAVMLPAYTVFDIIAGSSSHATLETAVKAARLDDELSGAGPFTVFAPTDDAFAALPEGTLDALLSDPTGELAQILLYHVVSGAKAMSTDLSDGQMITTMNGDSVMVKIDGSTVMIDDAAVTVADIEADNGVVHVIDAVLIPTSTVVDIIVGSPDHTTLESAVIAAGLADDLSGEGPFTVFAPTDAAFEALPAGTLAALLLDPEGALAQVLLYHVAGGMTLSGDLSDGMMIPTLQGESLTIAIDGSTVMINDVAMVVTPDLTATNGVVHVIDAVLQPPVTVVEIIANSPVHNTLESAVIAAELNDDLGGEGPFTVFAPTDMAFDALPEGTVDALLADPTGELAQILQYHVASGILLSGDLSDGQTIETLQGEDLTVSIDGTTVMINDATVVAPDIAGSNGVVHVIDRVLLPSTGISREIPGNIRVTVFPNPASDVVNVGYTVSQTGDIRIAMYDLVGQQVRYRDMGTVSEGSYSVGMPVSELKAGLYVLTIETAGGQIAKKVRIVK